MSWELGWVIKRRGVLEYLAVDDGGLFYWEENALDALHFYREEDAKSMIEALHMMLRVEYASIALPGEMHADAVHYAWV